MPKKKSGSRDITPEEQNLWQEVTYADKKLNAKSKVPAKAPENSSPIRGELLARSSKNSPFPNPPPQGEERLGIGEYIGIDRNTQERFRKGEMDVDGRLDLHGFIYDEARLRVADFVVMHYGRGSRFLLIITGKGTFRKEEGERTGVLRSALPVWLSEPDIRPYILAFDTAKAKHGGSGVFYVLLRRKRE